VYFGKKFSLRGVKSKKISSHPGRDLLKSVLKVRYARVNAEWAEREEELSVICIKMLVKGKGRDQSTLNMSAINNHRGHTMHVNFTKISHRDETMCKDAR